MTDSVIIHLNKSIILNIVSMKLIYPDKLILLERLLFHWDMKPGVGFSRLTFLVRSSSGHRPSDSTSWRGLSTSASSACLCTAHFCLIY